LLTTPDELTKMWIIRKFINSMDNNENNPNVDETSGTEFLIERLSRTKTNNEFFESMKK
jgi:transcription termination factor Rho